jgi:hypothetical protein
MLSVLGDIQEVPCPGWCLAEIAVQGLIVHDDDADYSPTASIVLGLETWPRQIT